MSNIQVTNIKNLFGTKTVAITSTSGDLVVRHNLSVDKGVNAVGVVTAQKFVGDGSGLSNLSAVIEGGIELRDDDVLVGTSGTISFNGGGVSAITINSGIASITIPGIPGINTTGDSVFTNIDISGNAGIGSLNVSGVSTFVGLSTFNDGIIVVSGISTFSGNIDANANLEVDGHTELDDLRVSGVSTLGVTNATDVTAQQLNVSGVSTLGVTTATDVTAQQLNVSGISTLGITTATDVTAQQLNVSGISTLGVTTATDITLQQLNVSGISTLGVTTATDVTAQQLNVSGISTITTLKVGTGITAEGGIVTATTFDGSLATTNLSGTITNDKLANNSVSIGGITFNLGDTDETPALDLQDATNYPFTSLTGIITDIVGDTTPQLGGDLDLNSNDINGTGNIDITGNLNVSGISTLGVTTATSVNVSGILTASSGIEGIGIQSGGVSIATGIITALNFIGVGNTIVVRETSVDIFIRGAGGIKTDANRNHYGTDSNASDFDGNANDNVLFGHEAGSNITTGDSNVIIGSNAGDNLTTGNQNTFIGHESGGHSSSAIDQTSNNTAIGYRALYSDHGNSNTAVGSMAGENTGASSVNNVFIGVDAGKRVDGNANIAIGRGAIGGNNSTGGSSNVCIGPSAGNALTGSGIGQNGRNNLMGSETGKNITTGDDNTFIGHAAGIDVTTGDSNTFIGSRSGGNFTGTSDTNNVAVGRSSGAGVSGSDNTIIGCLEYPDSTVMNGQVAIGAGVTEFVRINETGLGIGTDVPNSEVASDNNNILNVGIVTAREYYGDGSNIVNSRWAVVNNGSDHYAFTGPGGLSSADDPTLYLARGQTYEFNMNADGHPFHIQTSTGAYNASNLYTTGVTNAGSATGVIKFEISFDAPNTLYYVCQNHSNMQGTIVVYPSI